MSFRNCAAIVVAGAAIVAVAAPTHSSVRDHLLNQDLNQFIGRNVFGPAQANLGVVSAIDRNNGIIVIIGRHGEHARLSVSLLTWDGTILYASSLTAGDIKQVSAITFANSCAS